MVKALSKAKISSEQESSSRDRGRHRGRGRGRGQGRGRGHNQPSKEDKEKKPFDKSVNKCYICKKYCHFAYECRSAKKPRDDRAYVAKTTPAAASASLSNTVARTSSLLMAMVKKQVSCSFIDHRKHRLILLSGILISEQLTT